MSTRRIAVTGGTAGIGLAIARALLDRGHGVFVCGRSAARLEEALRQLEGRAGGAVCDVRDLAAVQAMIEAASLHLGGIDSLVNNAGIAFIQEFSEITPAMWREIVETNLTGVFNCSHAALPLLRRRRLRPALPISSTSEAGRGATPSAAGPGIMRPNPGSRA